MKLEAKWYDADGTSDDGWDEMPNVGWDEMPNVDDDPWLKEVKRLLGMTRYLHVVLVSERSTDYKFLVYRDGSKPTEFEISELVNLEKELRTS